jgi:ABC-2 type transport system permease protein
MRTILLIVQKEFLQIFRNKTMIPMIFLLPFVQLLILVNAAIMDMKNIEMIVVDKDLSSLSTELTEKFAQSPFFTVVRPGFSVKQAEEAMLGNKTDMILIVPSGFEQQVYHQGKADLQIQIDAINGMTAGLMNNYATQIINSFYFAVLQETGNNVLMKNNVKSISMNHRFWYNSQLNFKYYMVPGILAILLTVIGMFLASLNLVREKEIGTIEQINVTPIRKYHFIIGKLLPFWIIAMFELMFGLALGKILFDIPMEGNLLLLFGFAALYLIAVLGIGLFISTLCETQQQAQFLNFFVLITFVMLSGIFTPAESMPHWAQNLNVINPIAYFIRINRMVLLKGSEFRDIAGDYISIGVIAIFLISLAIWKYRKIA